MKPVVLFVDDEPNILRGLQRMTRLGCDGWEIMFADGGQKALAIFENQRIDALVTDMRMPDVNGATLLQAVASRSPRTIRFLLSGEADRELTCGTIGVSHQFFAKPCDGRSLIVKLTAILEWQNLIAEKIDEESLVGIDRLSASAKAVESVSSLLTEPATDFTRIANAIKCDAGLSLRILQLANSSYFGNRRTTCDIRAAVGSLGVEVLNRLFRDDGFTRHPTIAKTPAAIDLAEASLSAARAERMAPEICDTAYAAGLLLSHARACGWSTDGSTAPSAYLACLIGLPPGLVEALDKLRQIDTLQEPAETGWQIAQAAKSSGREAA